MSVSAHIPGRDIREVTIRAPSDLTGRHVNQLASDLTDRQKITSAEHPRSLIEVGHPETQNGGPRRPPLAQQHRRSRLP